MDKQTLFRRIEERQDELYSLLSELIRFNSENDGHGGNEKECAEYVAEYCRKLALETDIYSPMELEGFAEHPDYLPGKQLENRPNVTARWKGSEDRDALMLMGHTDTVIIGDLANWTCDPLGGEIRDGKIWGRGATDDKYAVAAVMFLMKVLKEEGFAPKANLLFTAYCDEEKGGSHGALASALRYPCERVVNLDCVEDVIWHCASGGGEVYYRWHTKDVVSSTLKTMEALPSILEEMAEFGKRREAELEANRFYRGTDVPGTSLRYLDTHIGNMGADLDRGKLLFVFYTDKTKDEIWQEFAEMDARLREKLEPLGIIGDGFEPETRFFHYQYTEPDIAPITDLVEAAREITGSEIPVRGSCLSDLSVILKYGCDTAFAFGIGRDFDQYGGSHQPDEHISCEKLLEFTKILAAYILKCVD